jgi:hypothetical protein
MIWYKGWLETRFRLLFSLGYMGLILVLQSQLMSSAEGLKVFVSFAFPSFVVVVCAMFSGAGIATQPSFVASKGLHGSTLFTLSMPVSRFRLLAVRAAIGWLEAAGVIGTSCCLVWFLSPILRTSVTIHQIFQYAWTLIACATAVYSLSVLLATFLDDQWRVWSTILLWAALSWVSTQIRLPAFADIFRAVGKGSPLIAHTIPWSAIAFSLVSAMVSLLLALRVVCAREY